jgi:hypothetical protein
MPAQIDRESSRLSRCCRTCRQDNSIFLRAKGQAWYEEQRTKLYSCLLTAVPVPATKGRRESSQRLLCLPVDRRLTATAGRIVVLVCGIKDLVSFCVRAKMKKNDAKRVSEIAICHFDAAAAFIDHSSMVERSFYR